MSVEYALAQAAAPENLTRDCYLASKVLNGRILREDLLSSRSFVRFEQIEHQTPSFAREIQRIRSDRGSVYYDLDYSLNKTILVLPASEYSFTTEIVEDFFNNTIGSNVTAVIHEKVMKIKFENEDECFSAWKALAFFQLNGKTLKPHIDYVQTRKKQESPKRTVSTSRSYNSLSERKRKEQKEGSTKRNGRR